MQDWKDALGALRASGAIEESPEDTSAGNAADKESAGGAEGAEGESRKLPKVNFFYEKKGRAGKPATILTGFAPSMTDDEIEDVARKLKQRLGCGGSTRGGEILLQGDRRDQARTLLKEWGFKC